MKTQALSVAIDTTFICQDFFLKGRKVRKMFTIMKAAKIPLFVPAIVFDEAVKKFRDETDKIIEILKQYGKDIEKNKCNADERYRRNLEKGRSDVRDFVSRQHSLLPPGNGLTSRILGRQLVYDWRRYKRWLEERLSKIEAQVLDYPATEHKELVRRALLGRKPFATNGRLGYRDCLVWETVANLASDIGGTIVLVTANSNDFAETCGLLHADLRQDLVSRCLPVSSVVLCGSAEEFNQRCEHKHALMQRNSRVEADLANGQWGSFSVSRFFAQNKSNLADIFTKQCKPDPPFPGYDFVDLGLEDDFVSVTVPEVCHLGNGQLMARFILTWAADPGYRRTVQAPPKYKGLALVSGALLLNVRILVVLDEDSQNVLCYDLGVCPRIHTG